MCLREREYLQGDRRHQAEEEAYAKEERCWKAPILTLPGGTDWSLWGRLRACGWCTRTPAVYYHFVGCVFTNLPESAFREALWVLLKRWRKTGGRLRGQAPTPNADEKGAKVFRSGCALSSCGQASTLLNQLTSKVYSWITSLAETSNGESLLWKVMGPRGVGMGGTSMLGSLRSVW